MPIRASANISAPVVNGGRPLRAFVGDQCVLADIEGDFTVGEVPAPLSASWTASSGGDNRLAPVSDGAGGLVYARMKAGELPVVGCRRVANLLPDLNLAGWLGTKTGGDAVLPVLTANYGTDPVYGTYGRIQLDAGTTGTYSWAYKRITTSDTRRHLCRSSAYVKLNTGSSVVVQFTRGLGTGTLKTLTDQWQRIYFDFAMPAGANSDIGIGFNVAPASGTARTADILIAMNNDYGPQVEELSDQLSIADHAYLSPSVSYGFGANGVRYLAPPLLLPYDFSLAGSTFYDFFDRADTSDGDLGTAPVGSLAWSMRGPYTTGGMPPISLGRISGKKYVMDPPATTGPPARAVYATQQLRGTVRRIGAVISYVPNTGANQGVNGFVWTLAIGASDPIVLGMIHFTGTHLTWSFQLWLQDGSQITLTSGTFSPQLSSSGKPYYVEATINEAGDTATIIVPGSRITVQDARMAQVLGPWCFWEHFVLGPSANLLRFHATWASEAGQSALDPANYAKWQPSPAYPVLRPQPSLTQAVLWSTDPSNAAWTKTNVTIAAQTSETQKLGGQQVWKIAETTANGLHGISQATGIGAAQQTAVAIVKAVERTRLRLRLNNATDGDVASAIFDISPYELPSIVSGAGAINDMMHDNLYILSVTGTPTVTGSAMYVELVSTGTTVSYAGTTGSGVLVYYAGAEPGGRFTAPVVTEGSSVVRVSELPDLGVAPLSTSWRIWGEIYVPAASIVASERIIGTNVAGGVAILRATADGRLQAYNGSTVLESAAGLLTPGRHSFEVRRTGATAAIDLDGATVASGTFDFGLGASPHLAIGAAPDGSGQGVIQVIRYRCLDTSWT